MTRSIPLFLLPLLALGLAGCASDTLPPPQGSAASATPATGGPLGNDAKTESGQTDQGTRIVYDCDNGQTVTARYNGTDHARVSWRDQTKPMHIAISADGARYVGGRYEWWTRGKKATLFSHQEDGSTGNSITTCSEQ